MGNRPYQEQFPPDSSGNLPVSEVWHNFRKYERPLARMGFYLSDIVDIEGTDELNVLKSRVLKKWRAYSSGDFDDSAMPFSPEELKASSTWVSTLTIDDVEELSITSGSHGDADQLRPSRPWLLLYPGLVALGALLEYVITHWLHR